MYRLIRKKYLTPKWKLNACQNENIRDVSLEVRYLKVSKKVRGSGKVRKGNVV